MASETKPQSGQHGTRHLMSANVFGMKGKSH